MQPVNINHQWEYRTVTSLRCQRQLVTNSDIFRKYSEENFEKLFLWVYLRAISKKYGWKMEKNALDFSLLDSLGLFQKLPKKEKCFFLVTFHFVHTEGNITPNFLSFFNICPQNELFATHSVSWWGHKSSYWWEGWLLDVCLCPNTTKPCSTMIKPTVRLWLRCHGHCLRASSSFPIRSCLNPSCSSTCFSLKGHWSDSNQLRILRLGFFFKTLEFGLEISSSIQLPGKVLLIFYFFD